MGSPAPLPRTHPPHAVAPAGAGWQATERIVEEASRACAERFGPELRALVLTGSLAREEGTFAADEAGLRLLGDAEFLLVFHERTRLPPPPAVVELARVVEERLARRGLRGIIGLSPCPPAYLRGLGAQIFAFELRTCGRVVAGDRDVLSLVPRVPAAEIEPTDAWMLLCNRMVEQLGALAEEADGAPAAGSLLRYHTAKLWLDMATSFLVFAGGYAPTYQGRAARLSALAARPAPALDAPLDLPRFAARVQACTRFKLGTGTPADRDEVGPWREAAAHARRLWRWELARLAGGDAGASDRELSERWMRRQRLAARARGWAYAARRHGWHRSWRLWPRWARLARRGSPRHWVYAAATELLFTLAGEAPAAGAEAPALRKLARSLPVCRAGAERGWRTMAGQVYEDYRSLLVETRT